MNLRLLKFCGLFLFLLSPSFPETRGDKFNVLYFLLSVFVSCHLLFHLPFHFHSLILFINVLHVTNVSVLASVLIFNGSFSFQYWLLFETLFPCLSWYSFSQQVTIECLLGIRHHWVSPVLVTLPLLFLKCADPSFTPQFYGFLTVCAVPWFRNTITPLKCLGPDVFQNSEFLNFRKIVILPYVM